MPTTPWLTSTALVLTILGCLTSCGESGQSPPVSQSGPAPAGPDPAERERDNTTGFPLEGPGFQGSVLKPQLGTSFAHGTLIIFNRGRTQLRFDKVTPIGVDAGLRPLGVRVAGLDRKIGFDQASEWPVTSPDFASVRTPEGFVLEPADAPDADRGYEILLGYKVVGPERSTVKGVRIDYTDLGDGSLETITFRETLAVCPDASTQEDCPVEE